MWTAIGIGLIFVVMAALLGFLGGYRLGFHRRRVRLSPEEFRILGEEYEIKMRRLIDENKMLGRRWLVMGKLITSLGAFQDRATLIRLIARTLKDNLSADYAAVLSNNGRIYSVESSDGIHIESEEALVLTVDNPLIEYLGRSSEVVTLKKGDRQFKPFSKIREKVSEVLMVSMNVAGKDEGILWTARKFGRHSFSEGDKLVLKYIGNAVGYMIQNIKLVGELESRALKMVMTLAKALEQKDEYTRGHSDRVATYAVIFSKHLGIPAGQIDIIKAAALLHDIGKIGVPDDILRKPGKLTEEEYEKVKLHPLYGAELLKSLGFLKEELLIIIHHHEKFDGTGYPYRLKGDQIPLGARIVSITNVFDALTSDRSYRKAFKVEEALKIMEEMGCEYFDPGILDQFFSFVQREMKYLRRIEI